MADESRGGGSADAAPGRTWLLCQRDVGRCWWLDAAGPHLQEVIPGVAGAAAVPEFVSGPPPDSPPADQVLVADGHELLAWLLGRGPGEASWVAGGRDPVMALALPQYFPYP